ncbi:glycosyltransferase [Jatrophihabitans sp. YIM 134969]
MRVSVVLEQALAPVPGGTGRYARELAAALARTGSDGDEVVSWVAAHRHTEAARLPHVEGPHRLSLPAPVLARAWARGTGPTPRASHLVHAPTLLMPPVHDVPLVVTVHDVVPWTHPETLTAHGAAWHREMGARAAEHAAAVTVPTDAVAGALREVLPQLDPDKLHVLGAGVSTGLIEAAAAEDADTTLLELGVDRPFVLVVGTLEPRKGVDVAMEALAALPAERRPLLVLVGATGWGGVEVGTLAAKAGLDPEDVRPLGRLADVDLGVLMARARAVLVPSRAEGFGLPVAEAMAVGTPVVVTDVPALVEVAGGCAAAVVPVGDALALADAVDALDHDPAERVRRCAAARERADAFSWDTVATRAWTLYRRLRAPGTV